MSEGICADCSSPDPSWASINHGVLVCDECCSVHRSLGRHISFVRSLHSTSWPPALREMVSTLVRKGSNSIWEHALHDSSSKVKLKKPSPRDKLHPNKHDFIIAKYKHLALLPRATLKESATMNEDLSKQLHASVRTSNLETCLRLLSLGADPNYLHLDRGNTPVHVAAHAGQAMQVELLLVHGGNPTALDLLGHTPEECARIAGHHQLADRLIECQYELTDKLSLFVSGRKPMHSIGEHFLVPPGVSLTGPASDAKSKLQELTNEQFEDLAADVYDEVDRRECDSIWLTTQQLQNSVAFLPVNPALSSTRNQGRQKLATLDSNEFCQLVIDILLDTKVRQNLSLETGQRSGTIVPAVIGALPEHDYEDVPVEEEEGVAGAETTPPTEPGLKERRTRSKLTPPIESMYSVAESGGNIMTTPTNPRPLSYTSTGREDNYNRLHETKRVSNLQLSEEEEQQYAYTTVPSSDKREGPIPPPPLKPRPQTEYARLHNKGGGAGKSDGGGVARNEGGGAGDTVSKVKFNVVMEQLRKVQHEKEELEAKNEVLTTKVAELQKQLNKVIEENSGLRRSSAESATPKTPTSPVPPPTIIEPAETSPLTTPPSNGHVIVPEDHSYAEISRKTKQPKPVPPVKPAVKKVVSLPPGGAIPPTTPPTHSGGATPTTMSPLPTGKSRQSLSSFESHSPSSPIPTGKTTPLEDSTFDEYPRSVATPPPPPPHRKSRLESQQTPPLPPPPAPASSGPTSLPSMDVIQLSIKETTQRIQVLLKAAQSQRQNEFASCSQAITATITKLTELFPKKTEPQEVYASIKELERACSHLQNECQNPSKEDLAYHTRLVMNGAYDVAKAARFLVTCMEKL